MNERPIRIERQGRRQFNYPDEHERSDLARSARHRKNQPGQNARHGAGQYYSLNRLPLRCAAGEGTFSHAARDGNQRFLCCDDHHQGPVIRASVSAAIKCRRSQMWVWAARS